MSNVIRYIIMFGIVVFLGTCIYLLENNFTLQNVTRFVNQTSYGKDVSSFYSHDVREQIRLVTKGFDVSTQGYRQNVNIRASYQTTPHYENNPIFHVNGYNITDETLYLYGYMGKNNSTSSVRLSGLSNLLNMIKPYIKQDNKLKNIYLPHKHYFHHSRIVTDVNCNAIFHGDIGEIKRTENITKIRKFLHPQNYSEMTKNCSHFKRLRGYIDHHLTEVERDFPIAFSLLMFTDIEQSERLLRAIYRPQNYYCIHVDSKTDQTIYDGMSSIASCFDNVFMTSKRFNVQWGTMTVLEPELLCMEELWNKSAAWKYFINLTGQEFPLRTNYELVRILQAYNGSNDIEGTFKRANRDRWQKAGAPPHNITAFKGSVHVVVNRGFVDFALHDQRAHDLLNWTRQTQVPDETFFSTLNHNPHLGVPGSYLGVPETDDAIKPFMARFKDWGERECHGKHVRLICVIGTGDLPDLARSKKLFVNKFHQNFHHFGYDCLEELIANRTRDIYLGDLAFDSRYYGTLGFVKNKI
ncbi:beta-1,3-galactosyl-O-glycosyl-glycoprotein beta-1,6-N-acetylglucosaminyltransferase-like isoform X3 [Dreissena polymorpha]|nr:beta-1,3-galactosyl-O-glycosyl-glycoprotein beta-1,6-N-acetylglucosaminyltransferase-like isoform X3 [Dreissena polymorpha]